MEQTGFDFGSDGLTLFFGALAVLACLYTLLSVLSLRRLFPKPDPAAAPRVTPSVTILKPLYGAEEGLYENLLTFCRQNYSGRVQILFGVHEASDPAALVARRIVNALRAERIEGAPVGVTAELIIDSRMHGTNGKVSNLINLSRRIEGEMVVLADSDISVTPDYLNRLAAALEKPGVGAVTTLYRGVPMAGLWSQLCAMGVDYTFLPNVVTGVALKLAEPCIGATIALRRTTLEAIGGFQALKDQLADDFVLGAEVRATGQQVVLADFAVGHAHGETRFEALWRQEMRWARTVRGLDPLGYAGTAVTYPFAWAVLAMLTSGFSAPGVMLVFAALACRLILQDEVDRRFPGHAHALPLAPLRDLLGFAVYVGSFLPGKLSWRGADFTLARNGAMQPLDLAEETAPAEAAG
jgi:ceramide glucosyltransferase